MSELFNQCRDQPQWATERIERLEAEVAQCYAMLDTVRGASFYNNDMKARIHKLQKDIEVKDE